MNDCKTVTLRTRPLKNRMLSFYLDYYPGYRDKETMKVIRHIVVGSLHDSFYFCRRVSCALVNYLVPINRGVSGGEEIETTLHPLFTTLHLNYI